jgi:hypothetical protein
MEFGKDPTSGVYGLKVDDIQGFGGHTDSFTVRFTICGNSACENVLQGWDPMVAYKASTCVAYDTLENQPAATLKVTAFPNPFTEQLHFEWTTTEDTSTKLELLDQFGGSAKVIFDGRTERNEPQHLDVSTTGMSEGIYYYRFTSLGKIQYGKLIKN